MNWSEIPKRPASKILRQFAGAWLIFFVTASILQGFAKGRPQIGMGLMLIGVAIGIWGLLRPDDLRVLFLGCMMLAFPIGWLVSQVVLAVMFYGIFTPVALLFRLIGRDALGRGRESADSYWVLKESPREMRRYFRQY